MQSAAFRRRRGEYHHMDELSVHSCAVQALSNVIDANTSADKLAKWLDVMNVTLLETAYRSLRLS
ncbi:hypothetical protein PsorP6_004246 [Peronosclerospora sorghi]|uniref:Uncharacterized protein n=1 Tax=Peronosclerospora sorghi TaxID=230839 RepID=A0ACC0VJB1_9STRA|nr:hypothetical protein PsorP6_004246 [Peronosclerospora sorghi]